MARAGTKHEGHLSSIEKLPEAADDLVRWCAEELLDRRRPRDEVLEEFNGKLAKVAPEAEPISRSAFHRYARSKANEARQATFGANLKERVNVAQFARDNEKQMAYLSMLVGSLCQDWAGNVDIDDFDPKDAKEMVNAVRAITAATASSTAHRQALDAENEAAMAKAVEATLEKISEDQVEKGQPGLSKERSAQIRRDVLGVRA